MKTPSFPLAAVLCLLVYQSAGPRARAADNAPIATLWLGDAGVDIEKARALVRERYETARRWEIDQNLAAYEKIGKKDPRWDEAVRETLRNSSNFVADQPGGPAAWDAQHAACAKALASGCDDPLVVFLGLRTGNYPPETSNEKLAQLYTDAERNLAASGYSPLRKFYAAFRTVQTDMLTRRSPYGRAGQPQVGESTPAESWAEGTDVTAAFQHGLTQLKTLLEDRAVPPMIYYDAMKSFMTVASCDPIGRAEMLVPLENYFASGKPESQAPAVARMFEGRFWSEYAWDARGSGGTDGMSDDQKALYYGRLDQARTALEESWKLDPTQSDVAVNLMNVTGDQSRHWAEIDQWFRRAMNTKPNSYDAALLYLHYLGPNWGGNEKRMVDFGRKCFASRDAFSRLPLVLLDAHWRMGTRFSDDKEHYWQRPDVWADLHLLFEFLTKERPDIPAYRTDYAIYAWRAHAWRVARQQFELIGDKPDAGELRYFKYTPQQFEDMHREATEGAEGDTK